MMETTHALAPRLLNIQQAAKYLGCPVWTLRNLEWNGRPSSRPEPRSAIAVRHT